MLSDLCKQLNNYFDYKRLFGSFTVKDGILLIDEAHDGQYIRICDSVFNDGVYKYPVTGLKDETFEGAVWLMAVPEEVVTLSKDIDEWKSKYQDIMQTPFQSESFGGYSYSKGSSVGSDGTGISWSDVFADRIRRWQKI